MKREINDDNFVTIQGWVITHLQLDPDEALVYSLIFGYPNHTCAESVAYIGAWIRKSEHTARRILHKLVAAGFLKEKQQSGKYTIYTCNPLHDCNPLQNCNPTPCNVATPPLASVQGDNNNIDNINNGYPPTPQGVAGSSFLEFWDLFKPTADMGNRKKRCQELWESKPEDERACILARLALAGHEDEPNPWKYLANFGKKKDTSLKVYTRDEIYSLTGSTEPSGFCILRRQKKGGGALWAKTADAEKCGELTKRIFI